MIRTGTEYWAPHHPPGTSLSPPPLPAVQPPLTREPTQSHSCECTGRGLVFWLCLSPHRWASFGRWTNAAGYRTEWISRLLTLLLNYCRDLASLSCQILLIITGYFLKLRVRTHETVPACRQPGVRVSPLARLPRPGALLGPLSTSRSSAVSEALPRAFTVLSVRCLGHVSLMCGHFC